MLRKLSYFFYLTIVMTMSQVNEKTKKVTHQAESVERWGLDAAM